MPLNFTADVDVFVNSEEDYDEFVIDNASLSSANIYQMDGIVDLETNNANVDEVYPFNQEAISDILELNTITSERNTLSKVANNETTKKYDYSLKIKEIEKDFDKSSDKASLFDTLNSLKKQNGWEKKVQDFAKKSINDNLSTDDEEKLEDYVSEVTEYGIKSFPKTMTNEIKEKVSTFVKIRLNSVKDAYKEALLQAAEKSIEPIKEIMSQADYDKPSSSKVVYVNHKKGTQDKMGQVKPKVSQSFTETIVGQGTYHEEDFNTILRSDVKMSLIGDPDYNSDEESGIMPRGEEIHLISKLEREAERQIRIQNDFREALNPNIGLELNSMYSDHKHIMDTIARLRSDAIEIYNDSIVANHDKTLPPPEVLTYKYKGRIYKLVTIFEWIYLDDNNQLPSSKPEKRVNKIQKFYLHLPPPAMLPMRKRLFNIMEIPAACSPSKISKTASNLTIGGVKIGKSTSPKQKESSSKKDADIQSSSSSDGVKHLFGSTSDKGNSSNHKNI